MRRTPVILSVLVATTVVASPPTNRALADPAAGASGVRSRDLLLDCERIEGARRLLEGARRRAPSLQPAQPVPQGAPTVSRETPSGPDRDTLYHIEQNLERFAALSARFQCDRR